MVRRGMGLLPCPFCGGRPLVLIQQDGLDRVMRIECMTCHCSTPQLIYYHEPKPYDTAKRWVDLGMRLSMSRIREELMTIWNGRAEDADESKSEG